ncbi:hypothetical protein BWQ96_07809 [Gracilariopsis chorda]|uniref:Uncharacterized protein n=1 Tax=Gracilariopsis chorda TaxID=448386 RepID=A0A2V3IK76_9FLOR|nr:hypothetical protein BWQ96_07809 [Gracilariopsis chorda]|eukprot:PXF42471.1 hypothetical protein BWQ96_07809 [Gracilariopsis chorda]
MNQSNSLQFGRLTQRITPLNPHTFFPSFDYVGKPYADIVDAIVIILMQFIIAAILSKMMSLLSGGPSKSLSVISYFNRLVGLSLSAFNGQREYQVPRVRFFSNPLPRLTAMAFFVLYVTIEALLIFSQTSAPRVRSIPDLKIRSLGLMDLNLSIPSSFPVFTCTPLVSTESSSTNVRLALCVRHQTVSYFNVSYTPVYAAQPRDNSFIGSADVQFDWSNPSEFRIIDRHSTGQQLYISFSIQLSDSSLSKISRANLTKLGFQISATQKSKLQELFQLSCRCKLSTLSTASTVKFSFSNITLSHPTELSRFHKLASLSFNSIIQLSNRTHRSSDFIPDGNPDITTSEVQRLVLEAAIERVKRLSGINTWILTSGLLLLNLILNCVVGSHDERVNAVKTVADLPPDLDLHNTANVLLVITEVEAHVSSPFSEEIGALGLPKTSLRLRRRNRIG